MLGINPGIRNWAGSAKCNAAPRVVFLNSPMTALVPPVEFVKTTGRKLPTGVTNRSSPRRLDLSLRYDYRHLFSIFTIPVIHCVTRRVRHEKPR